MTTLHERPTPPEMRLSLSTAHKVGGIVIGFAAVVFSVATSYAIFKNSTDLRLEEAEKRVAALESQKSDVTALNVVEQGKQISDLRVIVSTDHDAIVRILAVMERQTQTRH